MAKKVKHCTDEEIRNNCSVILGCFEETSLVDSIKKIEDAVHLKCGSKPDRQFEYEDSVVIGYFGNGEDGFDARRFGRVVMYYKHPEKWEPKTA